MTRDALFIAFFLFIIGVITAANRGALGNTFALVNRIPYFDKVGHFVLMGILAFLAIIALAPKIPGSTKSATMKVVTVLISLIALEEASQYFIPSRTFSPMDFFCGLTGVLFATWAALLFIKSKES